jgi:zinc and cadmium transporter
VLTSIPLGATTALAVAAHEIPQEVGDFAILLRAGYSRSRALTLNVLSATGGVLGALAMLAASQTMPNLIPYVLSFAAGSFCTWQCPTSFPTCTEADWRAGPAKQLLLIGAGILTIVLL